MIRTQMYVNHRLSASLIIDCPVRFTRLLLGVKPHKETMHTYSDLGTDTVAPKSSREQYDYESVCVCVCILLHASTETQIAPQHTLQSAAPAANARTHSHTHTHTITGGPNTQTRSFRCVSLGRLMALRVGGWETNTHASPAERREDDARSTTALSSSARLAALKRSERWMEMKGSI